MDKALLERTTTSASIQTTQVSVRLPRVTLFLTKESSSQDHSDPERGRLSPAALHESP